MFKAIYLTKENNQFSAKLTDLDESQLPADGDVLAKVEYSTINYKDGLALTDKAPVVRKWPMVPGIDFAGVIESSSNPEFRPGEACLVVGCEIGEIRWGGLAQKIKLHSDWLVRLPKGMTTRRAMAIGTAGYTAMLCILALEKHGVRPGDGDILVTGATGGVGSIAVAVLGKLGYKVVVSTGKLAESDYLKDLGAAKVIDRATLSAPGKAAAEEKVCGSCGLGRQPHIGQRLRPNHGVRSRHRLRLGARNGFSIDGGAVHSARGDALRHPVRNDAKAFAFGGMEAIGDGS